MTLHACDVDLIDLVADWVNAVRFAVRCSLRQPVLLHTRLLVDNATATAVAAAVSANVVVIVTERRLYDHHIHDDKLLLIIIE